MKDKYDELIRDGDKHFDARDYDKAISCFTEAIESMPENSLGYSGRGIVLRRQGNLSKAAEDFDRVGELNPSIGPLRRAAKVFRAKLEGDFETVKEMETIHNCLDSGRRLMDGDISAEEAIIDYSIAISLDSQCSEAYLGRGIAYKCMDNFDLAIADFDKSLEMDPENWGAYSERATTHMQKRDFSQALFDAKKLVALRPEEKLYRWLLEQIERMKRGENIVRADEWIEEKENKAQREKTAEARGRLLSQNRRIEEFL